MLSSLMEGDKISCSFVINLFVVLDNLVIRELPKFMARHFDEPKYFDEEENCGEYALFVKILAASFPSKVRVVGITFIVEFE